MLLQKYWKCDFADANCSDGIDVPLVFAFCHSASHLFGRVWTAGVAKIATSRQYLQQRLSGSSGHRRPQQPSVAWPPAEATALHGLVAHRSSRIVPV